ncbi:MAG TPA: hypothetical protein VFH31_12205 [Pyrinomonadaceae bacterium]|nr:hypothetical protein [Pyrinomonadaceae bacterium]
MPPLLEGIQRAGVNHPLVVAIPLRMTTSGTSLNRRFSRQTLWRAGQGLPSALERGWLRNAYDETDRVVQKVLAEHYQQLVDRAAARNREALIQRRT